jgi:serine/threonine protein phosphatase PrpC
MSAVDIAVAAGTAGQDRAAAFDHGGRWVLVIADGAGGVGGGQEAAEEVVAAVERAVAELRFGDWPAVLHEVDRRLADRGHTTAVIAEVRRDAIAGASVGDSVAWVIGDDPIEDLTERQSRKPLIGSGSALATPFMWGRTDGTALLLATDGLHRYAARPAIVSAIRGGASAAAIIDLARLPSGALHDDVAVVLYRFAATDGSR